MGPVRILPLVNFSIRGLMENILQLKLLEQEVTLFQLSY